MAEADHAKLDIAREYLDTAMQLYMEQRHYFCAIHLACAAEELLGAHLPKDQRIFDVAVKAQTALKILDTGIEPNDLNKAHKEAGTILNLAKNTIKHMNDGKPTVTMDPVFVALHSIEDALINFYTLQRKLNLRKSPILWKFEEYSAQQARREFDQRSLS